MYRFNEFLSKLFAQHDKITARLERFCTKKFEEIYCEEFGEEFHQDKFELYLLYLKNLKNKVIFCKV